MSFLFLHLLGPHMCAVAQQKVHQCRAFRRLVQLLVGSPSGYTSRMEQAEQETHNFMGVPLFPDEISECIRNADCNSFRCLVVE